MSAAKDVLASPKDALARVMPRATVAAARVQRLVESRKTNPGGEALTPSQALRENGFTIFRGLFSQTECVELAAQMKAEAGIENGKKFTNVDATNRFTTPRQVLFDDRVQQSVRTAVGQPVCYLQVSDLHYLHDTAGWHRDSVHRAHDASDAADWSDDQYGVVKAILYMECDNAAMGIMCGSHLSPHEIDLPLVDAIEEQSGQIVVGPRDEPNRRFGAAERKVPLAWQAQVGDLLVFDERMYHAGRRVDNGRVTQQREAPKFTLSMVFGPDNMHSQRLYSYFRFARKELHYKDFVDPLHDALAERNLLLGAGQDNYYLDHPEDLRMAYLRYPSTMDSLVEEFTQDGRSRRANV